jgi:hypothetical protein
MHTASADALAEHLGICSRCSRALRQLHMVLQASRPGHATRVLALRDALKRLCPLGLAISRTDHPQECAQA